MLIRVEPSIVIFEKENDEIQKVKITNTSSGILQLQLKTSLENHFIISPTTLVLRSGQHRLVTLRQHNDNHHGNKGNGGNEQLYISSHDGKMKKSIPITISQKCIHFEKKQDDEKQDTIYHCHDKENIEKRALEEQSKLILNVLKEKDVQITAMSIERDEYKQQVILLTQERVQTQMKLTQHEYEITSLKTQCQEWKTSLEQSEEMEKRRDRTKSQERNDYNGLVQHPHVTRDQVESLQIQLEEMANSLETSLNENKKLVQEKTNIQGTVNINELQIRKELETATQQILVLETMYQNVLVTSNTDAKIEQQMIRLQVENEKMRKALQVSSPIVINSSTSPIRSCPTEVSPMHTVGTSPIKVSSSHDELNKHILKVQKLESENVALHSALEDALTSPADDAEAQSLLELATANQKQRQRVIELEEEHRRALLHTREIQNNHHHISCELQHITETNRQLVEELQRLRNALDEATEDACEKKNMELKNVQNTLAKTELELHEKILDCNELNGLLIQAATLNAQGHSTTRTPTNDVSIIKSPRPSSPLPTSPRPTTSATTPGSSSSRQWNEALQNSERNCRVLEAELTELQVTIERLKQSQLLLSETHKRELFENTESFELQIKEQVSQMELFKKQVESESRSVVQQYAQQVLELENELSSLRTALRAYSGDCVISTPSEWSLQQKVLESKKDEIQELTRDNERYKREARQNKAKKITLEETEGKHKADIENNYEKLYSLFMAQTTSQERLLSTHTTEISKIRKSTSTQMTNVIDKHEKEKKVWEEERKEIVSDIGTWKKKATQFQHQIQRLRQETSRERKGSTTTPLVRPAPSLPQTKTSSLHASELHRKVALITELQEQLKKCKLQLNTITAEVVTWKSKAERYQKDVIRKDTLLLDLKTKRTELEEGLIQTEKKTTILINTKEELHRTCAAEKRQRQMHQCKAETLATTLADLRDVHLKCPALQGTGIDPEVVGVLKSQLKRKTSRITQLETVVSTQKSSIVAAEKQGEINSERIKNLQEKVDKKSSTTAAVRRKAASLPPPPLPATTCEKNKIKTSLDYPPWNTDLCNMVHTLARHIITSMKSIWNARRTSNFFTTTKSSSISPIASILEMSVEELSRVLPLDHGNYDNEKEEYSTKETCREMQELWGAVNGIMTTGKACQNSGVLCQLLCRMMDTAFDVSLDNE